MADSVNIKTLCLAQSFCLDRPRVAAYGCDMEKSAPKLIKHWLDSEGRKIKWLAAQVSADRSTVSLWLHGHQMPKLAHRQELERVTGLPVAQEGAWL